MDSQLAHSGTADEDDQQQHEKTSFYQKVKAKARRMKKSIGNKMHGSQGEHENVQDEDDDEEELEEESDQVHEAPLHESATAGSRSTEQPRVDSDPLQEGNLYPTKVTHPTAGGASMSDKPMVYVGHSSSPTEDSIRNVDPLPAGAASSHSDNDQHPLRTAAPENYQTDNTYPPTSEALSEYQKDNLGHMSPLEKDPHGSEQPSSVDVGHSSPLEKEPHGSEQPSSVNMGYSSHSEKDSHGSEQPSSVDVGHLSPSGKDPHGPMDPLLIDSPGNYHTKVTDSTYGGGKDVDVDPIVSSFREMDIKSDDPEVRITSSPTGSHDQFSSDYSPVPVNTVETYGNPQSAPLRQSFDDESKESQKYTTDVGEHQPTNQGSSYAEQLSYATSAVADSAISAKNVVASKLGFGDNEGSHTHDTSRTATPTTETDVVAGTNDTPITTPTVRAGMGAGTVEYGKQIASSVYDTVAGAGSTVASKIPGIGSSGEGTDDVVTHSHDTTRGAEMDTGDKGVSVKGYLAEKFSPGENDKALSEMITGALHKSDEDKQKEHSEKVEEAMGRVTESEEVAKRLGTDEGGHHGSGDLGSGVEVGGDNSPGLGMVDRFKGSVAYWFGGNTVDQAQPTSELHSPNTSNVEEREHDLLAVSHHEGDVTAVSHEITGGKGV